MIFWNAVKPFIYFTVLVAGSLCLVYIFDRVGGDGEYSAIIADEVHKVRCNMHISKTPCTMADAQFAGMQTTPTPVKALASPPAKSTQK